MREEDELMKVKAFIQRHPVATYFSLVFLISYGSFLLVVGPKLLRGGTEQASDAEYVLSQSWLLGVCCRPVDGRRCGCHAVWQTPRAATHTIPGSGNRGVFLNSRTQLAGIHPGNDRFSLFTRRGAQDCRITSEVASSTRSDFSGSPAICWSNRSTAIEPISLNGWRIVVSGGLIHSVDGMSSKPMMLMSWGTRMPCSERAR